MKSRIFQQSLSTLAAFVLTLGVVRADPVLIAPGESSGYPNLPTPGALSGTEVYSTLVDFSYTDPNDSANTVTGQVGAKVLSNATGNIGGLTFVYELLNAQSPGLALSISNWAVSGWAGHNTAFTMGNSFFFFPDGTPVLPLSADRSGDGDRFDFTFPLDEFGPPIWAGENSFQLVVHTDASQWQWTTGALTITDFFTQDGIVEVATLTAAHSPSNSVPDGGTTALLCGFALVALYFVNRRAPRAELVRARRSR